MTTGPIHAEFFAELAELLVLEALECWIGDRSIPHGVERWTEWRIAGDPRVGMDVRDRFVPDGWLPTVGSFEKRGRWWSARLVSLTGTLALYEVTVK